jgi:hypothetical protein
MKEQFLEINKTSQFLDINSKGLFDMVEVCVELI